MSEMFAAWVLAAVTATASPSIETPYPQSTPTAALTGKLLHLAIKVSSDRGNYSVGDPVMVSLSVRNLSTTIIACSAFAPAYWLVDLKLRLRGTIVPQVKDRAGFSQPNLAGTLIRPGETIKLSAPLSAWGYAPLTSPGTYELDALAMNVMVNPFYSEGSTKADVVLDVAPPISFVVH